MARYTATIRSHRTASDTFAFLADFSTTAEWDPGVVRAERLDDGPVAVGSRFHVVSRFLGREVPLEYTVTALEAPTRVVLRGENATTLSIDEITVRTTPDGAEVTYDADLTLKGPAKLLDPLLGLAFGRLGDRAADGLRAQLAG